MLVMFELTALDRLSALELALVCLAVSRSIDWEKLSTKITPEPESDPDTAENSQF